MLSLLSVTSCGLSLPDTVESLTRRKQKVVTDRSTLKMSWLFCSYCTFGESVDVFNSSLYPVATICLLLVIYYLLLFYFYSFRVAPVSLVGFLPSRMWLVWNLSQLFFTQYKKLRIKKKINFIYSWKEKNFHKNYIQNSGNSK